MSSFVGSNGVTFVGSQANLTTGASTTLVFTSAVAADTQKRYQVATSGAQSWGSGSATQDVFLYRSAANTLAVGTTTSDAVGVVNATLMTTQIQGTSAGGAIALANEANLTFNRASAAQVIGVSNAGAAQTWKLYSSGAQSWGDGTAANDTFLYRSAANTLTVASTTGGTSGGNFNASKYKIGGATVLEINGSDNFFVGVNTNSISGSVRNLAVGITAGNAISTGSRNVCLGYGAGNVTVSGNDNTCLGYLASTGATGSNNVIVGSSSYVADTYSGSIALGVSVAVNASNTAVIGTTALTETKHFGKQTITQAQTSTQVAEFINTGVAFPGGTPPGVKLYQNQIHTTAGSATPILIFTIPTNSIVTVKAVITGRCTGGTSGTVGNGGVFEILCAYKNVSGVNTAVGTTSTTGPIVSAITDNTAWTVSSRIDFGGTDLWVTVTGAANMDMNWISNAWLTVCDI